MLRRDCERLGDARGRGCLPLRCERSGVSGARGRHEPSDVPDVGPDLQALRVVAELRWELIWTSIITATSDDWTLLAARRSVPCAARQSWSQAGQWRGTGWRVVLETCDLSLARMSDSDGLIVTVDEAMADPVVRPYSRMAVRRLVHGLARRPGLRRRTRRDARRTLFGILTSPDEARAAAIGRPLPDSRMLTSARSNLGRSGQLSPPPFSRSYGRARRQVYRTLMSSRSV